MLMLVMQGQDVKDDAGEDVVYKIELVVFDYDIRPFFDLEEL